MKDIISHECENAEGLWLYEPWQYEANRYVLGIDGSNPLICIGVNPSTASPVKLDPTVRSVARRAVANGYDGWIMFNLSPQRATNPDDMDKTAENLPLDINLDWFESILDKHPNSTVWLAWGNLIEKRKYLKECADKFLAIANKYNATLVVCGPMSKNGNPHHPLYLKNTEPFTKI